MAVIELSAKLSGASETKALGGKQISLGATLVGSSGSGAGRRPQPVAQPKAEPDWSKE